MNKYLLVGILFGMMLLAGCGQQAQTQEQAQQGGDQGQMVGNDRDEHGCIPSAGYSWCEPLQKCIRPWEEECTTEQAPECTTVADCGLGAASCVNGKCSQYDEHGCVPDGGYTWCEPLQKCIRPWEENCTGQMVGNDRDAHGCIPSAGYSWCEATEKCYRPWEENCTSSGGSAIETKAREFCGQENIEKVYVCGEYIRTVATLIGGGSSIYDANGTKLSDCPMVNPEYFSDICKKVLMESNCAEQEIC